MSFTPEERHRQIAGLPNGPTIAQLALDVACPGCEAERLSPCVNALGIVMHGTVCEPRIHALRGRDS